MGGDADSLGEWVLACYGRAYRTAVMICRDPADAEEAVQDAFLRVWRFRDALPPEDRRDAWLYRVLVNACNSKLRRDIQRREREVHDDEVMIVARDAPDVDAERSLVARALGESLQELPEPLRVVVVLRYYGGLSERELAIAIRRRPGTVKSRLSEARRRLAADPRLAAFASDVNNTEVTR